MRPQNRLTAPLSRQDLYRAWYNYYSSLGSDAEVIDLALGHVDRIVGRMRAIAHVRERLFKGYNSRELNRALSMALSVHQQLSRGLHPSPGGVKIRGRRVGFGLMTGQSPHLMRG